MPPANRRYSEGFSRCTVCEAWIMWDGMHCPCCHFRLRKVSRNGKYKPAVARI